MNDSAARKATPIFSGVMRYFPNALAAVARLSKKANDKHNPGEPMHWSRDKSNDHGDCIARHQLTPEVMDEETGELHACAVAWRALAQLELLEEARILAALSGPHGRVQPQMVRHLPELGEGWIPWHGDTAFPAFGATKVKLRNGGEHKSVFTWLWKSKGAEHMSDDYDVVAYQIGSV